MPVHHGGIPISVRRSSLRFKLHKYFTTAYGEVDMDPLVTPGSWNKTQQPYRFKRPLKLECNYCKQDFDLPLFPKPIQHSFPNHNHVAARQAIQAQANEIRQHERVHHEPVYKAMEEHLKANHKIKQCDHCKDYVVGSHLKKHQKSYDCKMAQRHNEMRERGYAILNMKLFTKHIHALYTKISENLPWDDGSTREKLKVDLFEAEREFKRLTESVEVLTFYSKSPNDLGWQEQSWAPAYIAHGLMLIAKVYSDDLTQRNREAWRWLQMDSDARDAQIGGYELMLEYGAHT